MGKAQKLKEQRKIERITQERYRQKKKKKRDIIFFFIILILAIAIGLILYISYLNKEKSIIRANIETEKGDIKLELYKKAAPNTVENFVKLAEQGFYDNNAFHRVVEDFVIQGGAGVSMSGPGYTFEDEINPKSFNLSDELIKALEEQGYTFDYNLKSIPHKVGTISMANSGPNTNNSQFFIITTKDHPDLDGRYTAFGQVIEGMEIVRKIEQDDIIKRVTVIK